MLFGYWLDSTLNTILSAIISTPGLEPAQDFQPVDVGTNFSNIKAAGA
jgi:hypothetical protein